MASLITLCIKLVEPHVREHNDRQAVRWVKHNKSYPEGVMMVTFRAVSGEGS